MKSEFIIDILGMWAIVDEISSVLLFRFLIIFKYRSLFLFLDKLIVAFIGNKYIYNLLRLFILFLFSTILCHLFACSFLLIIAYEEKYNSDMDNWFDAYDMHLYNWMHK